ncbi:uncharacterized protein N7483_011941 [Penicillium malachiteum]|uniref:uncharacterized protein n=1 Tax=Penicillium malachiteum TaxID=1324776 RepID=UPI0025484082|nr:uncharacterized protein N7483_011941 [Penicillium malachiteum]KAJ5714760.1 hypothetical protein N7483_011941 [Penicillium malachiteum]
MSSHTQLSSTSSTTSTKLCSRTYKKASQLFLTRRLPEALFNLQPILTVPSPSEDQQTNGDYAAALAPIATASSTWRIKVWNFYITLLSAIVELGAEEGKNQFGQKEWKDFATQVREGGIWEHVVQVGYQGREGSVDAEVVYVLYVSKNNQPPFFPSPLSVYESSSQLTCKFIKRATLLLNHSSSQALNQQRLETYLSSYGQPNLDLADRLQNASADIQQRISATGGTDTPKDLTARVRIIELFTLHVLPRNEEWEYAQEFINLSEVLDEDRKELFLQTLEGLKEEKERGEMRAAELQRAKDAELERQQEDERRRAEEEAAAAARQQQPNGQKRNTSEVDYGIEKGSSRSGSKVKSPKSTDKSSNGKATPRTALSSSNSKNTKKPVKPVSRGNQARAVATSIRNLFKKIIQNVSGNPLSLVRLLLFVLGILMAFSRQDIRERVRRITGSAWQKVKGTVGMGVKVSYI